jgi:asparagine synthase (glutamine-hydrolysing)
MSLIHAARAAFAPDWVRRGLRRWRSPPDWKNVLSDSLIYPGFAARIGLRERLETLAQHARTRHPLDRDSDIAGIVGHPYIVCGVERYERVAAACGVETRHPFLDRRVVEFCMRLPDSQKLRDGWPKSILRRAMAGYLPETVNWRYGKQHLGEYLTLAYAKRTYPEIRQTLLRGRDTLAPYIRLDEVEKSLDTYELRGDPEVFWRLYETAHLANWLQQQRGE